MFDLSWTEIALLVIVALICIGPKDLPVAMRTLSKAIRAVRRMGAEFQQHLDEMVKEADLSETRDQLRELRQFDLRDQMKKAIDPDKEISRSLEFETSPQNGLPSVPAPPPAPSVGAGFSPVETASQPYNERMKEQAEALESAPSILPPTLALRLIEEADYWHRPAMLPPEVALHHGKRVVIVREERSDENNHTIGPLNATEEEQHGTV